jgi:hypothetical protein
MSQIEESLMNSKKMVNGMGKKCNTIYANFEEQNGINDLKLTKTKTEFSDLCRYMERDLNELVN